MIHTASSRNLTPAPATHNGDLTFAAQISDSACAGGGGEIKLLCNVAEPEHKTAIKSACGLQGTSGAPPEQQNRGAARRSWWKATFRLVLIFIGALCFGAFLNWFASTLDRSSARAGFARGVVQGALMPMSLPNLLVGRDVEIYSARNTGVTYKLGYTAGVNGCGAIFFSFCFWRITRWRRRANACQGPKA